MTRPDYSKVKTEFDYLLWLVIDSNPEVANLDPNLIEFAPLDEKYVYNDKTVSVDLIYHRPGKPPARSTVTYNRGNITQFCSGINTTGNNGDSYGRLTYEADRTIVRECRASGLDIDPSYLRYNLRSTSAGGKTELTFTAQFNTRCLYGSFDVKMNNDSSRNKPLAQCLTQKTIGQLSARDLSYYGKQYGNALHTDPSTNDQLKVIYGAIIKKNPALTGITQAVGCLTPRTSYTYTKKTTEFIVKDPIGETEVTVNIDRIEISRFTTGTSGSPWRYSLTHIPRYCWTIVGVKAWIVQWMTKRITEDFKFVAPRAEQFQADILVDGTNIVKPTDSWLNTQTRIECPIEINDLCYYQGAANIYFDRVDYTVLSTITSNVLVGVLLSDVTA